MPDYKLSDLTKLVRDSFNTYDQQGTRHWTWQVAAQDLSYQIGSLNKVLLQLSGDRWADGKNVDALEADLSDELADILAEVLYIASIRRIDLGQAINDMVKTDQKKVNSRLK
jgi:hypothetical protein